MTEGELILRTARPATRKTLAGQLQGGGLKRGAAVIVHTSLSALGWIAGGPVAVIQALSDCVGPEGTLVMPAHTAQLTDPAGWRAPAVPDDWIETLREEMPAYDPATTPTRDMGAVAELFRTWPGVKRSLHPTCSFAALGRVADAVTAGHDLEDPLGETSPLAKLYDEDADILLLGVDFDACTMLHLAEQRAWPDRPRELQGSPILEGGLRRWKTYSQPSVIDSGHFLPVGRMLIEDGLAGPFTVGAGRAMLVSSRATVDLAVRRWSAEPPPRS